MLRVTIHEATGSQTLQLEGSLAGPWVQEAHDCWQRILAAQPNLILRLDLTGVTMIDDAGKALLADAHAKGAKLLVSGCMMRATVADITTCNRPASPRAGLG